MAKNYTFNEAVKIIAAGTDLEAIADIGRRFPVLAHKVAVVATKAGDDFVSLMGFMPEYLTANKVNSAIKAKLGDNSGSDDASDDEAEAETEAKDAGKTESTEKDYESMSGKELWDLLGKAGKRKLAKSTKKADLVEACKKAFGGDAEAEAEEETETEEKSENPYDGKSAMELFKECKKRGIKAAPKKPAKFYADLLAADDAKSNDAESDDWDDGDEAEAKDDVKDTKKTDKKTSKKGAEKSEKKSEKKAESDDDDDWDI